MGFSESFLSAPFLHASLPLMIYAFAAAVPIVVIYLLWGSNGK